MRDDVLANLGRHTTTSRAITGDATFGWRGAAAAAPLGQAPGLLGDSPSLESLPTA